MCFAAAAFQANIRIRGESTVYNVEVHKYVLWPIGVNSERGRITSVVGVTMMSDISRVR